MQNIRFYALSEGSSTFYEKLLTKLLTGYDADFQYFKKFSSFYYLFNTQFCKWLIFNPLRITQFSKSFSICFLAFSFGYLHCRKRPDHHFQALQPTKEQRQFK